jgi:hypothetical protein
LEIDAQVIFTDLEPFSDSIEIQNLYQKALCIQDSFYKLGYQTHTVDVLEIGEDKFLTVDGMLSLFKWQQNDWINLSKSKFHGYNFRSKKIVYNGTVFSFGGYGFWREQGDLIKFDWKRNEWETSLLLADEDIGNNIAFTKDEFLYIINPISRNQHIDLSKKHEGIYRINLQNRKIDILPVNPILNSLKFAVRLETKNYYLVSRDPFQIIDKRNMKAKLSDITQILEFSRIRPKSLLWIHGDTISMQANDSVAGFVHIDLDSIYRQAPFPEHHIIKETQFSWIFSVLIMLIGGIAGIWYYKLKKIKPIVVNYNHPLIDKILVHSGKLLTQEELDVIFGIEYINPAETQRSKRSNLYNEVNHEYHKEHGTNLITRNPDPMDKRKFLYRIS